MKHYVKILALGICFALLFSFVSCTKDSDTDKDNTPGKTETSNVLSLSAKELCASVTSAYTFSDMTLTTSDDENGALTLMFSYGIADDALISAIEDYALGTLSSNAYPYYIGIIRTKDGTAKETVDAIAEAVKNAYPAYVISQMDQYNNAWSDVAKAFTLKTYDNGIVVVAYDKDGNEAIFDLIGKTKAE